MSTAEIVAEVTSLPAFIAAVRGAAYPTYEQAKQNPVAIRYKTTLFTFKEGIHERRAEEIAANIRKEKRNSRIQFNF